MVTTEKKLEVLHFFIKRERAIIKLGGAIAAEHTKDAEALAEIYCDIAKLNN